MRKTKRNRILTFVMAMVLAAASLLQTPFTSQAADENGNASAVSTATTDNYNVMLIIDKSGSMNTTDQDRLSLSAACQFVDQMSTVSNDLLNLSSVTSVGVMTFSQTTNIITKPYSLDSEANRNYLKSKIMEIQFDPVNTGGTDLSTAANDALNELKKHSKPGTKNMVVMFTDGYSENVLDENASQQNLNSAFETAKELQSNVYVVGLNHNGKIKEKGQQEIYNLANNMQIGEGISAKAGNDANASGDSVNYLITDNIGDVREFYGKIYANMIQSDLEYIENHEFIVDSSGILEADITIYSDTKINEVIITDPDGNRMIEDATSYFVSGDDFYKVVKILNPKPGKWNVKVSSGDENYKSYVIKFYGVEAAMQATWDTGAAMAESGIIAPYVGKVTLVPMYKGEEYTDSSFVESVTKAEFTATLETGIKVDTYPLTYVDGKYVGYFPVEQGIYQIDAVLATEVMNREVSCTLAVTNPEGIIELDLGKIWVKNKETRTVDLAYRSGTENISIEQLELIPNEKNAVTEIQVGESGTFTITAKRTGSDTIQIVAKDMYGIQYNMTGVIEVQFKLLWYHILLIVLLVLALLAGGWVLFRGMQRIPGEFHISVELLSSDNGYEGEMKCNSTPSPRGARFSLWKLADVVKQDIDTHSEDSSEGEQEISEALSAEKNKISKVLIMMAENKKKKKIYQTTTMRGSRDISDNTECYKSEKLSIRLSFVPLFEDDFEADEDDFGKATDFKRKKKSRSRQASTMFDDDFDE